MISASFLQVMQMTGYIFLALMSLTLMVVIHELGHYIAGKALGFKIVEFGIGFGPAIFKKKNKKNGEIFSIRPIPIGGFCQFEDEQEDSNSPSAFNNQKPWKRIVVLLAGALSNFISGLILIIIFFNVYGQILPSVNQVFDDSVNVNSLKTGDVFIKVNNKNVNILESKDLDRYFNKNSDQIRVKILRQGKIIELNLKKSNYKSRIHDKDGKLIVEKDLEGNDVIKFGYGFNTYISPQKLPFKTSIGNAFSFMFFVVYKIFSLLGSLFTGKLPFKGSVGGPITTISVMANAGKASFSSLMYIICLLSANLAVFNLLPIPALDGSKILFTFIEWIFKKKISRKVETVLSIIGLVLLLGLAIFADLFNLIR